MYIVLRNCTDPSSLYVPTLASDVTLDVFAQEVPDAIRVSLVPGLVARRRRESIAGGQPRIWVLDNWGSKVGGGIK